MSETAESYIVEDAEIVSDPAPTESTSLAVRDGNQNQNTQVGLTTESSFSLAQRAANLLCCSTLVPAIYQGKDNMANCVIALHMAARMKADPLMVMQNLYVIQGKPSWSSQFLIATFNSCGQFSKIRYELTGERGTDSFGCIAYATELATGEVLRGSEVTVAIAKAEGWFGKSGSKWRTMPEQMLKYRAAAWLIRAIAPELAMGLHTADEAEDISSLDVPATPRVVEPPKPPVNPMDLLKQTAAAQQPQPVAAVTPTPTPIKTCTPEQGSLLVALFTQCNFDIEAQRTVLGKRGVDSIRSLTEEQAATLIGNLQAKLNPPPPVQPPADPAPVNQEAESFNPATFAGGVATEPGQTSRDINGPCSPEQLKQIEDCLMQLEQRKPGTTVDFVQNLDRVGIALNQLTYAQADGLVAAIMVEEIKAFFDHQLSIGAMKEAATAA